MNEELRNKYEAVIGLEVHAQLLTKSKAFSWSSAVFGASPNTFTDPVTLAHPGALPVLNKKMVDYTIKMGLACNCSIREVSTFSRKNYFYQDLPKGYQISQYEDPICHDGYLEIETEDGGKKRIGITRIHMEEDTGKSIHDLDIDTLIDLNRAGVPLIEIVSGPDMRTAAEAYKYLTQLRQIVVYLGICTGNMEEGALRCDVNISVRRRGEEKFGTRNEIKNLNSFRNVEKAIEFEIDRQIAVVEAGGTVVQETRLWDGAKNETRSMRSKEMAHDYRYFPDPDLLPLHVDKEWIERIRAELPELPAAKKTRLIEEYHIPAYDAGLLSADAAMAGFYESAAGALDGANPRKHKLVSNWIMTEVMRLAGEKQAGVNDLAIRPEHIAELVDLIDSGSISSRIAKEIFPEVEKGVSPRRIVEEKGLKQVSDAGMIEELAVKVIVENPDNVAKYKSGRNNLLGFFVGQVIKQTGGSANPKMVSDIFERLLK